MLTPSTGAPASCMSARSNPLPLGEGKLSLRHARLAQHCYNLLNAPHIQAVVHPAWCLPACRGRAYLHVRVVGGKAFTDYLARAPRPGEQLLLSMELFGQRCTLPAVAAGKSPAHTIAQAVSCV